MNIIKTETVNGVYVFCYGIKKRCRKNEPHTLNVGDFPLETSQSDLISSAIKSVDETMKNVDLSRSVKMKISKIKLDTYDDGIVIREYRLSYNDPVIDITIKAAQRAQKSTDYILNKEDLKS